MIQQFLRPSQYHLFIFGTLRSTSIGLLMDGVMESHLYTMVTPHSLKYILLYERCFYKKMLLGAVILLGLFT